MSQFAQCQNWVVIRFTWQNEPQFKCFLGISSFPSVNLLYSWKLITQPDYRHPEGLRPGQPLKTGPKSDYLLMTGHSLPLSCSWLLHHLHTVWQYLHLLKQHEGAQGILQPSSTVMTVASPSQSRRSWATTE